MPQIVELSYYRLFKKVTNPLKKQMPTPNFFQFESLFSIIKATHSNVNKVNPTKLNLPVNGPILCNINTINEMIANGI